MDKEDRVLLFILQEQASRWLGHLLLGFLSLNTFVFSFWMLSHVRLFVTPWIVAYQAPLSMEFSSQEYRSGFPFPTPGNLPDPGIKPRSPALWWILYYQAIS